ncbi:MAG TPA: hypothetical protein ENJ52_07740 [Aliiroseovarius sp.]|nr:hypothetical protein [Aliiroseovarius sp.]
MNVLRGFIVFLLLLLPTALHAQILEEGENEYLDCVSTRFVGPEYASIIYQNDCDTTVFVKVCSKFLVVELWNVIAGRPNGGWMCSGLRSVRAGSNISVRITAVEESSLARKALAETSYRIFTCPFGLEPIIDDPQTGKYVCYQDPTGRPIDWNPDEFARLTAVPIYRNNSEIIAYVPKTFDCRRNVRHEIAIVLNDYLLKHVNNLIKHVRNVHLALQGSGGSPAYCVPYKEQNILLHVFLGEQKVMAIQYTAPKVITDITSDMEFITLFINALKQFRDRYPNL